MSCELLFPTNLVKLAHSQKFRVKLSIHFVAPWPPVQQSAEPAARLIKYIKLARGAMVKWLERLLVKQEDLTWVQFHLGQMVFSLLGHRR